MLNNTLKGFCAVFRDRSTGARAAGAFVYCGVLIPRREPSLASRVLAGGSACPQRLTTNPAISIPSTNLRRSRGLHGSGIAYEEVFRGKNDKKLSMPFCTKHTHDYWDRGRASERRAASCFRAGQIGRASCRER